MYNTDIISNKGKLWLAEKYDDQLYGGGWFASPVYVVGEIMEVRPAGGNWCYKTHGAIIVTNLTKEQKHQIYSSWLEHLKWTKKMVKGYIGEERRLVKNIKHFNKLIEKCT